MRVLCCGHPVIGVGHFVRLRAIARGLAPEHEVHLVDGGRPVPHHRDARDPVLLELPRVIRVDGRLADFDAARPVADVLAERVHRLADAVSRLRPDLILVDQYPFSKWAFDEEVRAAVETARRVCPSVRVVCSIRDNVLTSLERPPQADWMAGVLTRLERLFDAILFHADPGFLRLDCTFPAVARLPVPVHYTGIVVEASRPAPDGMPPARRAVVSCGGTTANGTFLVAAVQAVRALAAEGRVTSADVFAGPASDADVGAVRRAAAGGPVRIHGFSPDFAAHLPGSALSISRAGYNTVFQVLAAGVPSVVVPSPTQPEQGFRGRHLHERGLAVVVAGDPPDAEAIARAAREALARPRAPHGLDLTGVATTRTLIEKLAGP